MEIVTKKVLLLSVVLAAFGTASQLKPKTAQINRTKQEVRSALPIQVGDYTLAKHSSPDATVSDEAPETQYSILKPFDIVLRTFTNGTHTYDASVVVGNDRDTFHDPNYCMVAGSWNILSERIDNLETKTRGIVPVSVMTGEDSDQREGKRVVVFCYRGPRGFHATQNSLYADWFWNQLLQGKPIIGAFYRFMTTNSTDTEQDLLAFAAKFLDESGKTSGGEL